MGEILLEATDEALVRLEFEGEGELSSPNALLRKARRELESYLSGRLSKFTIPTDPAGTAFQRAVWRAMCRIPYGVTRAYGDLARRVHRPRAFRAVGQACNANPIAIIIPCHRVVGADGSLTGFGAGMPRKVWLLNLESS